MNKRVKIENIDVMELCENCTIAIDDNNIYYVAKFCNDCFNNEELFEFGKVLYRIQDLTDLQTKIDEIHKHNVITTKQITFAVVFWLSVFIVAVAIMYFFFYIN